MSQLLTVNSWSHSKTTPVFFLWYYFFTTNIRSVFVLHQPFPSPPLSTVGSYSLTSSVSKGPLTLRGAWNLNQSNVNDRKLLPAPLRPSHNHHTAPTSTFTSFDTTSSHTGTNTRTITRRMNLLPRFSVRESFASMLHYCLVSLI